jgi:general secretion pathway protein J
MRGFTLLEILIALFIFTLLSLILAGGLRTVINAESGSEKSAERLRQVQMALLIMSRDIEQTVNRPIVDAAGKEEIAFIGASNGFTLTHAGFANPTGAVLRSSLQRSRYYWDDQTLWRASWDVLDQAPVSKSHARRLLAEVTEMHFQYLDKNGRFYDYWPLEGQAQQPLPRAVRVYITIPSWGKMSQLYVISAQASQSSSAPPGTPPKP